MPKTVEMEIVHEIWPDWGGARLEVGRDRDGLGLMEIRYRDEKGIIVQRISFDTETAALLGKAIEQQLKTFGAG